MLDVLRDNWLLFLIGQYPNGPLGGLAMTVLLAALGLALSFPCAILLSLARISSYSSVRVIAAGIVHTVRGMPFLLVIFWSYFVIPAATGHAVSGVVTLTGALIVYESSYLAEVIRSGIQALPKGQTEAARALGFGYWKTMFLIIMPQALYNSSPALIGQFVSTIKETSLGYVIGVHEFTFAAAQVNNILLTKPLAVFSILALTYFALCFSLAQTARALEARIARRRLGPLQLKAAARAGAP